MMTTRTFLSRGLIATVLSLSELGAMAYSMFSPPLLTCCSPSSRVAFKAPLFQS